MAGEPVNDPFSTLSGAAIGMHEMLLSMIDAGFTRRESMELLVAMTGQWASRQRL